MKIISALYIERDFVCCLIIAVDDTSAGGLRGVADRRRLAVSAPASNLPSRRRHEKRSVSI